MKPDEALVFVTNNAHKIEEVTRALGGKVFLKGLKELGCNEDIPETSDTLEGNALQKARFVYERYGMDCFADDTGLEVEALDGRPGVYSARYAGEGKNFDDNMNKVLEELQNENKRRACFRTVIALIRGGQEYLFEGRVDGVILKEKRGSMGFGYDPLFMPDGFDLSFAEMDLDSKNRISHRGRAVQKLVEFLELRA